MHKIRPFQGASPAGIARFQAAQLRRVLSSQVKVEAGAYADIVAVEGNPVEQLEALQKPVFVMKAGKIFKGL